MPKQNLQKLPERVYYVFSSNDLTVLIALDLEIVENQYVHWFDTIKDRIMKIGKIVDDSPEHFVFERAVEEGGGVYTFIPMTLESYNEKVKSHLLAPREFSNKEDLLKAFEETRQNAW